LTYSQIEDEARNRRINQRLSSSPTAKGSRCSSLVKGKASVDFLFLKSGIDTLDKPAATNNWRLEVMIHQVCSDTDLIETR
jgi:hypothetical protein